MIRLKATRILLAVTVGLYASVVLADTGVVTGFVTRTLISDDQTYGGCMAQLSEDISAQLPSCGRWFVTFSCDGTYTDPVRALRMLDQAQLSLATGMKVKVFVDDSKKQSGYCFAWRIDLLSY